MTLLKLALAAAIGLVSTNAAAQGTPATKAPAQPVTKPAPSYAKEVPAKLAAKAKITEVAAAATALSKVPGGKIEKVELEEEDGKFIYSYDIKVAGKDGVQEVHVDAMTGAVLSNEYESPAKQKAEKEDDEKSTKAKAPPKPPAKKPATE